MPVNRADMSNDDYDIPGYRLVRLAAEGGCAEVYEARENGTRGRVALKILHPRHYGDKNEAKRLQNEGALGLRLAPNEYVARTLAAGVAAPPKNCRPVPPSRLRIPFIVLEYLPGRTLREVLRERKQLTEPELAALAGAVGRALRFLHNSGVLHKDIKPDNIMLDGAGHIKIIDFGFAVEHIGTRFGFWSRKLEGSPAYLAPELIKTKKASEGTDLYALGCTLYEAVAGKPPFTGLSAAEVLGKQTDERLKPRPLRTLNSEISLFAERLILNALEKNPKERYQSVDEFLLELSRNPLLRRGRSVRIPAGWLRDRKR